ncbi:chorismate-binding protein [uncultured Winogradskyella sp.]|uniref:chorismate-binding protein n=1 Tax=Winogradskyella sp. 4-2091 TaxID=3381659 RepID=UPI002618C459|nr:chorismate-binding protein [uncultured Winogradskyella sp.]
MTEDSFFEALQIHYSKHLPFVVYSKPTDNDIKCWLQQDATLNTSDSFLESGFLFSPFNASEDNILFASDACEFIEISVSSLNGEVIEPAEISAEVKDKIQHIDLITNGIKHINEDCLQKVVLSRCQTKLLQDKSPFSIFKRLFNKYKNAMVYCWYHPKVGLWLGATPELLLKVEGKRLTTISLAGTQPYRRIAKPMWSHKEYEEQQIVTDYITKQLEPFTKQINVTDVETVKAGSLLHLKTKVTSLINDTSQLNDILKALHPTPAVCGFPKVDAKEFILQNENYKRSYYTGFLGELNLKQTTTRNTNRRNVENNAYAVVKSTSTFYVNLRCMQLMDNLAHIYVGGGITKDSNPENEWEETVNKTSTIGSVLY